MENNKNYKKVKRLIQSTQQAKTALNILMQEAEKLQLEKGMAELLEKLKNPKLDVLLDRYPQLLQEHELEKLLLGELNIPGIEPSAVKTAGLLSCLQLIIHFCYTLKDSPNDDCGDSLMYILRSIRCDEFLHELLIIVISVTGNDHYQQFQQRIQELDLDVGSARLENEIDLHEYSNLIIWFALVRLLLESVYTYFNIHNDNPNKTTL